MEGYSLVIHLPNVSITLILAYRPLHFHAPGKLFFIVPCTAINTPKFSQYGSRSHFHPGPPSNVNTVLYNGAAPS